MHFKLRTLLSSLLIVCILITPGLHIFHVCIGPSNTEVSCSSHDHLGNCQNEEELNTEQECQICELLATFTLAYSHFDSFSYYLSVVINYKNYSEASCSLFLSRFSARAPPYL